MLNLQPGDVIRTSTLKAKMFDKDNPKPIMVLDYSAGRGNAFVCLFLGAVRDGAEPTAEMRLNALGWVYDPERAQALFDESKDEEAE